MSKSILVTGANGFIGSHIVECMLSKGYKVIAIVRNIISSDFFYLKYYNLIKFIKIDWNRIDIILHLKKILNEVSFVVHCAGTTKELTYKEYYNVNVLITKNLLEACHNYSKIKQFIFISSQAVSGPRSSISKKVIIDENSDCYPISEYAKSKLEAEKEVLKYKNYFSVTILRPCSVYGPRDKQFLILFRLLKKRLIFNIGKKFRQINMLYVKDLVGAVLICIESINKSCGIFFVTDGNIYSWKNIYDISKNILNIENVLELKIPEIIPQFVGWINDKISFFTKKPTILNSKKIKEILSENWLCNSNKIKNNLGFQAEYSLKKGISKTLNWYIEKSLI